MLVDDLVTYSSWDLEIPLIPARSRLYCLDPLFLGTPYVESLTSYIARLAEAHCLSTGMLVAGCLVPLWNKTSRKHAMPFVDWAVDINGKKGSARKFVRTLEILTLQKNLQILTMLCWEGTPGPAGLIGKRRWCPACYQEWRESQKPLYEPLLWSLNAVRCCPQHLTYLHTCCPHCGNTQRQISANFRPGYCSKCQHWLGSSSSTELFKSIAITQTELEWEVWVAQTIGEALAITPRRFRPVTKKTILDVYEYSNQHMWSGMDEFFHRHQYKVLMMVCWSGS